MKINIISSANYAYLTQVVSELNDKFKGQELFFEIEKDHDLDKITLVFDETVIPRETYNSVLFFSGIFCERFLPKQKAAAPLPSLPDNTFNELVENS